MILTPVVEADLAFIEGPNGRPGLADARDINVLLEVCSSNRTR
jgi:hypothetical protein